MADSVRIEEAWFEGNRADHSSAGAIIAATPMLEISGSTFVANEAERLAAFSTSGTCVIADSTFSAHVAYTLLDCDGVRMFERVLVEDNIGNVVAVTNGMTSGTHLVARRNQSDPTGVFSLYSPASFTCTCCDLGSGDDDNEPYDASVDGVPVRDLPTDFAL